MKQPDLTELSDLDLRYVAVIWRNDDDGDGRPTLTLGGCSEFEAIGLLRAALARLEVDSSDLIFVEGDEDEDEDAE